MAAGPAKLFPGTSESVFSGLDSLTSEPLDGERRGSGRRQPEETDVCLTASKVTPVTTPVNPAPHSASSYSSRSFISLVNTPPSGGHAAWFLHPTRESPQQIKTSAGASPSLRPRLFPPLIEELIVPLHTP
ncbi:hypothetical protein EYF80_051993 [Liparis tanakae]|uniref:Uncharacterized protein n=1 Tax=Liparis tanakae TaxID=230148 RepID=A0A4Z2FAA8_9TELE|nr:hypothetical protein EYF80_051993 [Liparis tanakae]